jgi:hypothetical protein
MVPSLVTRGQLRKEYDPLILQRREELHFRGIGLSWSISMIL